MSSHNLPQQRSVDVVTLPQGRFNADYARAVDISLPPSTDPSCAVSAFGAPPLTLTPVIEVAMGARCNCYNLDSYAPHLHGTHIETRQHIVSSPRPVVDLLRGFRFLARLITVTPGSAQGFTLIGDETDTVISRPMVESTCVHDTLRPEALIIRTPNFPGKETKRYGGSNPPYPHHELAAWCVERGIEHLVLDLPSADREEGELYFHRTFWGDSNDGAGRPIEALRHLKGPVRDHATITELAFIPDAVPDGWYILFLIPIGIPGDAAPVRPVIVPAVPAV